MRYKAVPILVFSVSLLIPISFAMNHSSVYRVPDGIFRIDDLAERIGAMTKARVVRVVDGDTVVVDFPSRIEGFSENEKVRLIGVDTPETVDSRRPVEYYGKEASSYTKELLGGRAVRLAFGQDLRDRYGRLLAYVFTEDAMCVNLRLVLDGFGFAYVKYPFPFMEEFKAAEKKARKGKAGLWGRGE